MSHELEIENGQAQMFYMSHETPWHGLGIPLDEPPTIEEAIRLAGLDWNVESKRLVTEDGLKTPAFANVRATDDKVLGVVGKGYKPLQNIDAFKWFQPFLDAKEATLETAGSLRGGRHIWALARVAMDPVDIVKDDAVLAYILLANSHNGTMSITAGFTGTRVVCQNTLTAATGSTRSKLMRVRHSKNAVLGLEDVRKAMDVGRREFLTTCEGMREMARHGVTVDSLRKYVRLVFEPKATLETDEEAENRVERKLAKIIPLFEHGRGNDLPGVKGTMWGAYNAVTEHLTWERGRSADTRLENLWLGGASAKLGQRAYEVALSLVA